jgi:hypothetical protein
MTVVDFARLDQIIADDWIEGYPDKAFTKAAFVADVKSGKHKLEACDFGPIDVKVLGDVAVVQGSATEHMSVNGQDSVLHTAFMDVFMKRSGKWVVIRSQSHKL